MPQRKTVTRRSSARPSGGAGRSPIALERGAVQAPRGVRLSHAAEAAIAIRRAAPSTTVNYFNTTVH